MRQTLAACRRPLDSPARLGKSRVGTRGILPGLVHARLAPSCRPCSAAKAGEEWGSALTATLIHPRASARLCCAGGRPSEVPAVSWKEAAGSAGWPQWSSPTQSARSRAQALPGCASPSSCSRCQLRPPLILLRCQRDWENRAQWNPTGWGRSAPTLAHAEGCYL